MKKRKAKIKIGHPREALPIKLVTDGAIATCGTGDGRLIPLVIVDTTERPDVEELVRVHQFVSPGDVECCWGELEGQHKGTIALMLTFLRPSELTVVLEFDISRRGGLVDQIVRAGALYIQPGRAGDRLATTLDHPRILVEVGGTQFRRDWDRMFRKGIIKRYRAKGLSRSESKQATERFIEDWRSVTSLRMKREALAENKVPNK